MKQPLKYVKRGLKKKRSIFLSNIVLFSVIILALLIFILLLWQIGIINNPLGLFLNNSQRFEIKDECSLIIGRLIHTISDEGMCRNVCLVRCESESLVFDKSEFTFRENNCNKCSCFCN